MKTAAYRFYSVDVKRQIAASRNPNLFPELRIPKSTAYHWMKHGVKEPAELDGKDTIRDPHTNASLDTLLTAVANFTESVMALVAKNVQSELNDCIDGFREAAAVNNLDQVIGFLPSSFLNKTILKKKCRQTLDGMCLKKYPQKLSKQETTEMKRLVTSPRYAHFSVNSLSWYAKREHLVHASRDTWYRYIREFSWNRPVLRLKPKKRRLDLPTTGPDQIWHLDATQIKLSNGRICYFQAILDNFSRRILAWKVVNRISAKVTSRLIRNAHASSLRIHKTKLVSDSGTENLNSMVSAELSKISPRIIQRVAKREISYSNSMIERLFHSLKNRFLYHRTLESTPSVKRAVSFYVSQHNNVIPMAALSGMTPQEVYNGKSQREFSNQLRSDHRDAQSFRLEINKRDRCVLCSDPRLNSGLLKFIG